MVSGKVVCFPGYFLTGQLFQNVVNIVDGKVQKCEQKHSLAAVMVKYSRERISQNERKRKPPDGLSQWQKGQNVKWTCFGNLNNVFLYRLYHVPETQQRGPTESEAILNFKRRRRSVAPQISCVPAKQASNHWEKHIWAILENEKTLGTRLGRMKREDLKLNLLVNIV